MVVTIAKIVDVIPLDGILAVLNSSLPCAFTRAGEISLEGGSASIENTDDVSIVSPSLSEGLLKRVDKLLERITLRLTSDLHLP